jgi:hypothetical protein
VHRRVTVVHDASAAEGERVMFSMLFICFVCAANFATGFALAVHFGHGPKFCSLAKKLNGTPSPHAH